MSKLKIKRDNFSIGKPYGSYNKVERPSQKGLLYIDGVFYSWPYAVQVYAEPGWATFLIYHSGRIHKKSISEINCLPSLVWLSRQANKFSKELIAGF